MSEKETGDHTPADHCTHTRSKRLKRITALALSVLASACLAVTVLLTCVEAVAFDENRYAAVQQRLDLGAVTGMSAGDMRMVTRETLAYCRGDRSDLNLVAAIRGQPRAVYGARELEHMVDVQVLFVRGYKMRTILAIVFLFLLTVLLYFARYRVFRTLASGWLAAMAALGTLLLALGIWYAVDFESFWTSFHLLFFTNDLWLLYSDDVLIQLFLPMFNGLVRDILIASAASLSALSIGSALILRAARKRRAEAAKHAS